MSKKAFDLVNYLVDHPSVSADAIEKQFGWAKGSGKTALHRMKRKGFIAYTCKKGLYEVEILKMPDNSTLDLESLRKEQQDAYWEIYHYMRDLLLADIDANLLRAKTDAARVAMKALSRT
ncbi:TPA: hypothetical protein ACHVAC_001580 [Streptococcus suis]|nr:MarR family transcriptional regulator [Streptococcus suis]HEL2560131.1 MarR family transcriptional regulator [Streptococcus suis]HEL2613037.1 MarR family transcriptional regulator [Streptococcus suis]HEL2655626.1 MarR family transcriptional regulator [Streptococcus suis]